MLCGGPYRAAPIRYLASGVCMQLFGRGRKASYEIEQSGSAGFFLPITPQSREGDMKSQLIRYDNGLTLEIGARTVPVLPVVLEYNRIPILTPHVSEAGIRPFLFDYDSPIQRAEYPHCSEGELQT